MKKLHFNNAIFFCIRKWHFHKTKKQQTKFISIHKIQKTDFLTKKLNFHILNWHFRKKQPQKVGKKWYSINGKKWIAKIQKKGKKMYESKS